MDTLTAMRTYNDRPDDGNRDFPEPVLPPKRRPYSMTRVVDATAGERSAEAKAKAALRTNESRHTDYANMGSDPRPIVSTTGDARTPRQAELMMGLLGQLRDLDEGVYADALTYTSRMTAAGKWTPGRDGNASDWISRMIAKVRELKARPVTEGPKANAWSTWRELAAKLVEIGGQHGARFAVDTNDGAVNELAFWWIVKHDGPQGTRYFVRQMIGGQGATRVRMSPEAMIGLANKINAAGPVEAMLRYGREIGRCGHCGRELTNDKSRDFGMGPKCRRDKGM